MELDQLVQEGYVAKDGDLYELTPKAEKILSDRGAGLNEARCFSLWAPYESMDIILTTSQRLRMRSDKRACDRRKGSNACFILGPPAVRAAKHSPRLNLRIKFGTH